MPKDTVKKVIPVGKHKDWLYISNDSQSTDTLNSWLGGQNQKLIWTIRIFKYEINIWKHL